MIKYRLISLSLITFFAAGFVVAQTAENKIDEKQKQQTALIEQTVKDAESLRLPENRALVLAKIGDGLWTTDEKRAREAFQNAVNSLNAAQNEAEVEKKQPGNLYGLIYGTSPRQEIMLMIANHDAELALDDYYKSRPAKIAQALAAANNTGKKESESFQYAQNEINFEQSLISKYSEQSPQRALKLFRQSLSKGVTYEAINFIEKLKNKDLELAAQLAADIADKLLATDFDKDAQAASLTATFVGEYGKKPEPGEKIIKIDDKVLRDLTVKFVKNILKSDDGGYEAEYIMALVEKYAPESVSALKQKKAKYDKENKREEYDAFDKLVQDEGASPEKLLSEAEKYPDELKNQIYYAAAQKIAQNGNVEQAKKLISSKFSEDVRESYLTQINYNLISQAITAEKYNEAAFLINQIPQENSRFSFLVQLATTIYQKNPAENKRQALSVIEQARALIPQPVETLEDMSLLLSLSSTLAEIDAEQAFPILEAMTYQINEYIEAAVTVGKYRNDGTVRRGEMLVNSYGSVGGLASMTQILTTLKKKDFGRAAAFVNGFQRVEVRVSLEMQLIDDVPVSDAPVGAVTTLTVGKAR